MVIYTYGVIDSKDTIDETILRLEGVGVYNVSYRDIGVAVTELRQNIQKITDVSILKHEEIIETLMTKFTVLPIRLSTIFNTKEELLSMVKFYYQDFKDNLARLRNKVEFGIKVIWSGETIKKQIIDAYKKNSYDLLFKTDTLAKTFLNKKIEKYKIEKVFEEKANGLIMLIDGYFNRIAVEKKLQKLRTENLLLNAYYLIEKEKQDDFKKAFDQLKSDLPNFKYLFSGYWPPYNFVTLTKKPFSYLRTLVDRCIEEGI